MAARAFRTGERRRRWAEGGVRWSEHFRELLGAHDVSDGSSAESAALAEALYQLASQGNTFAELERLKAVTAAATALARCQGSEKRDAERGWAAAVLAAILFEDNSRPLHRAVLEALARLDVPGGSVDRPVPHALSSALSRTVACADAAPSAARRIAQALTSLSSSHPALRTCLDPSAAASALRLLGSHLPSAADTATTEPGAAPTEPLQEALSATHLLLSASAPHMHGPEAVATAAIAAAGALAVLRKENTPRETAVAAGGALCLALSHQAKDPASLAAVLASMALPPDAVAAIPAQDIALDDVPVAAALAAQGRGLGAEGRAWGEGARMACLRAACQGLPPRVLFAPLPGAGESGVSLGAWAAALAALAAAEGARDAQGRAHTMAALCASLHAARAARRAEARGSRGAGVEEGGGSSDSGDAACGGEEGGDAAAVHVPPMGLELRRRVFRALWSSWEDPLVCAVGKAHEAFQEMLELAEMEDDQGSGEAPRGPTAGPAMSVDAVARDVLATSWSRKGKYAPLALLVPRLGPRRLLAMQPDLVTQCFTAMRDEVLCSAIAGFLKALVPAMAREAMGEGESWADAWAPPLLSALAGDDDRIRDHVAAFALPVIFATHEDALGELLERLAVASDVPSATEGGGGKAGAAICLLRAARRECRLDSLAAACDRHGLDPSILKAALYHRSEALQNAALALVCEQPRATAPLDDLELSLMSGFLPHSLRCTSLGQRSRWVTAIRKFLERVHAVGRRAAMRIAKSLSANHPPHPADPTTLRRLESFLQSVIDAVNNGILPSNSFATRFMATETLVAMLTLWPPTIHSQAVTSQAAGNAGAGGNAGAVTSAGEGAGGGAHQIGDGSGVGGATIGGREGGGGDSAGTTTATTTTTATATTSGTVTATIGATATATSGTTTPTPTPTAVDIARPIDPYPPRPPSGPACAGRWCRDWSIRGCDCGRLARLL